MLKEMEKPKNPAAVAMAKLRAASLTAKERSDIARKAGGLGGKARAKKLSATRRKQIAKKAAAKRWEGKK
jgi:hypothetical protein